MITGLKTLRKKSWNKQAAHSPKCETAQNVQMAYWFSFCPFSEMQTAFTNVYFQFFLFIKFILEPAENHRDLKYLLSGFAGTDTLLEMLPVRSP